jgi:hypothetical protein
MMPASSRPRGSGLISQTAAAEKGCSLKVLLAFRGAAPRPGWVEPTRLHLVQRRSLLALQTLQQKTAFSRIALVHRTDPGGQQRVELTHSQHTPGTAAVWSVSVTFCLRPFSSAHWLTLRRACLVIGIGQGRNVTDPIGVRAPATGRRPKAALRRDQQHPCQFGQEAPGEVGLSGRRAEIGNHEVAGKIAITASRSLPRNHKTPSSQ